MSARRCLRRFSFAKSIGKECQPYLMRNYDCVNKLKGTVAMISTARVEYHTHCQYLEALKRRVLVDNLTRMFTGSVILTVSSSYRVTWFLTKKNALSGTSVSVETMINYRTSLLITIVLPFYLSTTILISLNAIANKAVLPVLTVKGNSIKCFLPVMLTYIKLT